MPTRRKNVDLNRLKRTCRRSKLCELLSLSLYTKASKSTHSIYLFRPFAAHSIGYSVVCVGFSLKRYIDISYRDFKRMDVRKQNQLHFRILHDALPPSSVNDNACVQHSLSFSQKDSLELHEVAMSGDFSSGFSSRSVFILFRFGQSCLGRLARWTFKYLRSVDKQYLDFDCRTARFNHSSTTIVNGACITDAGRRRAIQSRWSSPSGSQTSRRYTSDNSVNLYSNSKPSVNGCVPKQSTNGKPVRERCAKEDPVTRLESNIRRLRSELQSMRGLETQLRNQLNSLQHDDHLNRLSLSNQRQENEGISSRISKLINKCRSERVNLNTIEQNLNEEIRLRQLLEAQLTEIDVIPVCSFVGANDTSSVPPNSTEKSIPTSTSFIQTSSNNHIANANVVILQSSESEKIMDNYCCRLRQLLESKICALRLTVKCRENSTLASKMHHSSQVASKCSITANSKMVDTSNYDNSVRQYDPRPLPCRLQSGHLLTKDVYCCILNSDLENLHNVTVSSQHTSTNNHRHAFLENCFNLANEKRERLANKLRTENWQKQELLTLYHTSVREITELNKTLKQRDLQILELTMKIEQLECLPKSTVPCDLVSHAGYTATTVETTEPPNDIIVNTKKNRLSDRQLTSNKQRHISSLLSTNTIGQFTNTSTNVHGNILIHSASEKYDSSCNNTASLQTSRFCASPTVSITPSTDFTNSSYPALGAQTTYHCKDEQNLIFTNLVTTNFHTNLPSSCLFTSLMCSSNSSSSSSSSNMSCAMLADVQAPNNCKESPVNTSTSISCPIAHQQHPQKWQ